MVSLFKVKLYKAGTRIGEIVSNRFVRHKAVSEARCKGYYGFLTLNFIGELVEPVLECSNFSLVKGLGQTLYWLIKHLSFYILYNICAAFQN